MKPSDILEAGKQRIATPYNVVINPRHLSENWFGEYCSGLSSSAVRFCLLGAIIPEGEYPYEDYSEAKDYLWKAKNQVKKGFFIFKREFNISRDPKSKNHDWMIKIYDRAIELAKADGK